MRRLRVLDLFSGIGGFSLGLERTGGFETVAFCEIEPYARLVLQRHWPGVPIYDDVRTLTADRLREDGLLWDISTSRPQTEKEDPGPTQIDLICGGFP